jgi:hypothetical protein
VKTFAIVIALLPVSAAAQSVQVPDEETKIKALKKAYELNGNSMVRWGSIDMSKIDLDAHVVRVIPIVPPARGEK